MNKVSAPVLCLVREEIMWHGSSGTNYDSRQFVGAEPLPLFLLMSVLYIVQLSWLSFEGGVKNIWLNTSILASVHMYISCTSSCHVIRTLHRYVWQVVVHLTMATLCGCTSLIRRTRPFTRTPLDRVHHGTQYETIDRTSHVLGGE